MSTSRPSQKQRAAAAVDKNDYESSSTSAQKRARSISPPTSTQNPPSTPAAKRAAKNPKNALSPSKMLTPEQRAARYRHVTEGLAEAANTDAKSPESESRKKSDRSALLKAIEDELAQPLEDDRERSVFSPSASYTQLPGIHQALLDVSSQESTSELRASNSRPLNGAAYAGPGDSEDTPMVIEDDDAEGRFWSSPARGTGSRRGHQNAASGSSNAHHFASSDSDDHDLYEREDAGRGPTTPRASGRAGNTGPRKNYIPTPPRSSSQAEGVHGYGRSPSSTAQVSDYLLHDSDEEDAGEGQAYRSAVARGKQRERASQARDRSAAGSQASRYRQGSPGASYSQSEDHLASGAGVFIEHATASIAATAEYIRKLEEERGEYKQTIRDQSERITRLEAQVAKLNRKVSAFDKEKRNHER
ncbi:hypothetical protein EIP86_003382 [Pleurotus ostreatoroseus]|nr:hypothetical protein EIP86_003382 [Pleurotus ostreatoroseus]